MRRAHNVILINIANMLSFIDARTVIYSIHDMVTKYLYKYVWLDLFLCDTTSNDDKQNTHIGTMVLFVIFNNAYTIFLP